MRTARMEAKVMEFPPVMTPEQAAAYLQISVRTLRNWPIPHTKLENTKRYRRVDIDEFLRQHGTGEHKGTA